MTSDKAGDERVSDRPSVAALDAILGEAFPVLDQGFVRVIDYLGDDAAIVQAARVSYGKGTKTARDDAGLIRYLMRHRHSTPFEMCDIKFHIKLPIFVARQWVRHRTASINEVSARYSVLSREFYLPELEHIAAQSAVNNQGRGAPLATKAAQQVQARMQRQGEAAFADYDQLLGHNEDEAGGEARSGEGGVARELARAFLPLSSYTQWYWKINLHNLLHFLALRADSHAQYEIRAYADCIQSIVARWVPLSMDAFRDYRLDAVTLSGPLRRLLAERLGGTRDRLSAAAAQAAGVTAREWREFCQALDLDLDADSF